MGACTREVDSTSRSLGQVVEVLPDESRRLTPQQQTAIEYLLLVATMTEAAGEAEVTRQTASD
jgi:hypothetical protein